jgi:hypothetical protein
VNVNVSLVTAGCRSPPAGNDITFDNTALSLNIGNCCVNPASVRTISGGVVNVSGNLTTMRIPVWWGAAQHRPDPDGLLYTCTFGILGSASPNTYTLPAPTRIAQDPMGANSAR